MPWIKYINYNDTINEQNERTDGFNVYFFQMNTNKKSKIMTVVHILEGRSGYGKLAIIFCGLTCLLKCRVAVNDLHFQI